MDTIRIFVGTDRWQQATRAEEVLEYSIRKHLGKDHDVDITFMRSGDPGWEISENGKGDTWAAGAGVHGGWVKAPGMNWGTPFSWFRFAVRELCGFEGHAIYLDSDMLFLDDVAELYKLQPRDAGYRSVSMARTDVSVINCEWFKDKKWWPSLEQMKATRARVFEYTRMMRFHDAIEDTLPAEWNDCDGRLYSSGPNKAKLIHYTSVPDGQPWRPYDNVEYPREWPFCRTQAIGVLWFTQFYEMLNDKYGDKKVTEMYVQMSGRPAEVNA